MKYYVAVFVSDGRYATKDPEMNLKFPKGTVLSMQGALGTPTTDKEGMETVVRLWDDGHPWSGCYKIIEVELNEETGEIT